MAVANKNSRDGYYSKVGIFMPCYNMGKYIDDALASLYNQSFDDFVLIIADDASTSKDTLKKLSAIARPRCQIYYEKKNIGLIPISNKYMAKLNADYIMLFSPDDKMHTDFLKEHVAYLDAHPDTQAVCSWIQEFGDGQQLIEYDDIQCKLPQMLVNNNFSGAALMRKEAWLAAGKHDTNKALYPNLDYDLWLSMLSRGYRLGTIQKTLFYWRVVPNSLSHSLDAKKMLVFRKALMNKYLPLYRKHFDFVINYYLEKIADFEKYYITSEEGHDWLDRQYRALTRQNQELVEEGRVLTSRLEDSIQRPYWRSALYKLKSRITGS